MHKGYRGAAPLLQTSLTAGERARIAVRCSSPPFHCNCWGRLANTVRDILYVERRFAHNFRRPDIRDAHASITCARPVVSQQIGIKGLDASWLRASASLVRRPANVEPDEIEIVAGETARRYMRDLWRYRELFVFLAWRDLLVRYKQTVVGVAWSIIRPVVTLLILTLVFGKLGKMPSGGVPYPLLVLCALLPWQFFSNAFVETGNSVVANSNLVSKVYFPRLIIPASSVTVSLVEFLISLVFLLVLLFVYRFVPPPAVVFFPLFALLALLSAFAAGVWAAALMVRYRDVRFIIPFAAQFGLYISPVGFFSKVVPEKLRFVYSLNPMVGVIDGFRWSILGGEQTLYWPGLVFSIVSVLLLLVTGTRYFRRTERTFADVI